MNTLPTPNASGQEFIAYYRLSKLQLMADGSKKEDPYGIESQKAIVRRYVERQGGMLLKEFTEFQSGSYKNRGKLVIRKEAVELARHSGAWLIFAYVDRISRDAAFTMDLKQSGIPFVCCDAPGANHMTIAIMAMMSEEYARSVSVKTKEAAEIRRLKGLPLGFHNHANPVHKIPKDAWKKSHAVQQKKVDENANHQIGKAVSFSLWLQGYSVHAIWKLMRARGIKAPGGGTLWVSTVQRWLCKQVEDYALPQPKMARKKPAAYAEPRVRL